MWMLVVCCLSAIAALCHGQCGIQQRVCECDPQAEVCEFTLEIEELQTFTSYKLPKNPRQVTPHLGGATYYLSQGKYIRSRSVTEEQEGCLLLEASSEEEFMSNGCTAPITVDGETFRAYIGVNGFTPGPTLIAHENQIISINVTNKLLTEVTSIHWHGIHQRQTPWMDGIGFISQAPIMPGATFRYIFLASPSGTHWYHSHMGAQRTDGLVGALIVRESETKENRSRELLGELLPGLETFNDEPGNHTLILMDWQKESSIGLFARFQSSLGFYTQKPMEKVPTKSESFYTATKSTDGADVGMLPFWSGLINGKGRHTAYTNEPVSYQNSELRVFEVQQGNLYRFRVIGVQSSFAYRFSIDEHKLIIVATDGNYIEPDTVDYIIVHSGERYDFVLNATGEDPVSNYWIRAETVELTADGSEFPDHVAEAILHYEGAPVPDPATNYSEVTSERRACGPDNKCVAANCPFKEYPASYGIDCIHIHQFRSLEDPESEELPTLDAECLDCVHFFNFGFEGKGRTSAINARNFMLPTTPYQSYPEQYQIDVDNQKTCQKCEHENDTGEPSHECACSHVRVLSKDLENTDPYKSHDPTIQMIISSIGNTTLGNFRNFSHPVHIHGHYFYVLHVEHGYTIDGVLNRSSSDIACDNSACHEPRWRVEKNLSEYEGDPVPGKDAFYIRSKTVRKDTVLIPAGGYAIVYLRANNPGYWLLHCHIEPHQLGGMAVILREYGSHPPPPADINKCGDFSWSVDDFKRSLAYTGEPSSNDSYVTLHIGWITMLSFLSLLFLLLAVVVGVVGIYNYRRRRGYKRV